MNANNLNGIDGLDLIPVNMVENDGQNGLVAIPVNMVENDDQNEGNFVEVAEVLSVNEVFSRTFPLHLAPSLLEILEDEIMNDRLANFVSVSKISLSLSLSRIEGGTTT